LVADKMKRVLQVQVFSCCNEARLFRNPAPEWSTGSA
jgi:hypothetical protein